MTYNDIGPFGGSFPILSLRTNKADVVVNVPQEVADKLDAAGEKWRVNGKFVLSLQLMTISGLMTEQIRPCVFSSRQI